MNSQLDLEALRELTNAIENSEKTPEVLSWMEEISQPSFGLVDSLILSFLAEMDSNLKDSNMLLRALTKLFEFIPESILPQLKANPKFPFALTKYLTSTKLQDLEGGGFLLLVEIFSSQGFKEVASDGFIKVLLDSLEYIQDERTYLSIVNILMAISSESKSLESDPVLKASTCHHNQGNFSQYIVHAVNKSATDQIVKIVNFLTRVFEFQEGKMAGNYFFYTNDFKVLCDVVFRDIGNTSEEIVREKELELLMSILKTGQYQKEKYRKSEFAELLQELTEADVSEGAKNMAQKIINGKLV